MSDVQRRAASLRDAPRSLIQRRSTHLRTFQGHNADTSNFTNPSLVSSNIPTLANPTRGFGLPTNNTPLETVTEVAGDLQEAQSADEQSLEPEAIKEKPLVHDISRISLRCPQPQLAVSQSKDHYQQSADWVDNQIMLLARPEPKINLDGIGSPDIMQRKCAACGQEEEVETNLSLQPATDGSIQTENNIESQLNSSKGGGSPLSAEVRDFMEPRFGNNFGNVRVHTDSSAVQMSESLGAQAFTYGTDVYFSLGKSPGNNELTAHELTHVVQQTGKVHKQSDTATTPVPVEQTSSGMPPKKGTTKIDKKNATITASGKNITEAITNLTSQGKGEAGSVTCAPEKDVKTYQAEDQSDEIVYEANVLVTETKAMPVWTELDQQCEPVKKEWARFYSALDTHENGHISIDEKAFKDLHKKVLGKTTSAADKIFNDTYTQANTDNNAYDTTTKHGLTQGTGVTPVQCGPEKVS
ncbi:eCIS core domain-containing protein [Nostoc sp.]|uniref:eCIS core domain-containing protein n=1 Tax=Nostoc sp. TaxID=1180 RepID=UPI002FF88F02